MAKIVLASGSPRRQELLRRIGVAEFDVRVPEVEEYFPAGLTPEETVCYISREKSQAVEAAEDEIVITADTMVFLDDKKLGKPADEAEALAMLTALQGHHHAVCTGVTVRQGGRALTRAQRTEVYFRPASEAELRAYIAGGDLSLMSEGKVKLQYLSDSANLIKGDLVVTSGLGGYYPSGLVIGTVDEVRTDDGGLARYAVLSPRCDLNDLHDLYIITAFDVIE